MSNKLQFFKPYLEQEFIKYYTENKNVKPVITDLFNPFK